MKFTILYTAIQPYRYSDFFLLLIKRNDFQYDTLLLAFQYKKALEIKKLYAINNQFQVWKRKKRTFKPKTEVF